MSRCTVCDEPLPRSDYFAGRPRLYCSNRCRQAAKLQRRQSLLAHFVSSDGDVLR